WSGDFNLPVKGICGRTECRLRCRGEMPGGSLDATPQARAGRVRDRDFCHTCDVPVRRALIFTSMAKRRNRTKRKLVVVNDRMQRGYRYELTAPVGRNFDPEFKPQLTPAQMLALGVFCGKYMTDTRKEFPASWFRRAKLAKKGRDCELNYFGIDAS